MHYLINIKFLFVVGIMSLLLPRLILLGEESWVWSVGSEDGPVEYCSAIFFLLASFLSIYLYVKSKDGNNLMVLQTKRNFFYFVLFILFFFAAGEEVSWGMRIFNLEVPEFFLEQNEQEEINIHNLKIFHSEVGDYERKTGWKSFLTMEKMFAYFWLVFCVLTPLMYKYSMSIKALLEKFNVPIVSLSIGLLFPVNYLIGKLVVVWLETESKLKYLFPSHEIKETVFGFLFLLVMYDLLIRQKSIRK